MSDDGGERDGDDVNTRKARRRAQKLPACCAAAQPGDPLAAPGLTGRPGCEQANSTAFDTMSNASLNTEDGAATYTNSEYTSHLAILSDDEEDEEDADARGHAARAAAANPKWVPRR